MSCATGRRRTTPLALGIRANDALPVADLLLERLSRTPSFLAVRVHFGSLAQKFGKGAWHNGSMASAITLRSQEIFAVTTIVPALGQISAISISQSQDDKRYKVTALDRVALRSYHGIANNC